MGLPNPLYIYSKFIRVVGDKRKAKFSDLRYIPPENCRTSIETTGLRHSVKKKLP